MRPLTDREKVFWEYLNYLLVIVGLFAVFLIYRIYRGGQQRRYESLLTA